jgi:hypothetical protein
LLASLERFHLPVRQQTGTATIAHTLAQISLSIGKYRLTHERG